MQGEQRGRTAVPRKGKSRIPTFTNVEDEAAFWDTHSLVEFEDELEEVTDFVFVASRPRKKGITVRLEEDTLASLTQKAREKGVGPSTLVRMWILERLREPAG